MSLVDELQQLEQLYRNGTLSDAEFAQAKATLLNGPPATPAAPDVPAHLAEQLEEVKHQNDLARLDRDWEMERQQYMVTTRYGRSIVPTVPMGMGTAIVGGLFGIFWTIMAISITGSAPDVMPFSMVKFVFPIVGLCVIGFSVWWGIHCVNKAHAYQAAWQNYQARRQQLQRRESL